MRADDASLPETSVLGSVPKFGNRLGGAGGYPPNPPWFVPIFYTCPASRTALGNSGRTQGEFSPRPPVCPKILDRPNPIMQGDS